jgi:hypothetical protein
VPSKAVRLALFLSAYSPLLALLAILKSFGSDWSSYLCAGLALGSILVTWAFWGSVRTQQFSWLQVTRTRPRDADVLNFFITYVVPFAAAPLGDTRARIALIFFLLFIAALYVRASLYQIHPLLLIVGYHLYELDLEDGSTVGLLTKKSFLPQNRSVRVVPLMPSVFLEKSE